jgi:hypothetical protein
MFEQPGNPRPGPFLRGDPIEITTMARTLGLAVSCAALSLVLVHAQQGATPSSGSLTH